MRLVEIGASAILRQGALLRRLYSTFARGGPGVGLLLLRLAAGMSVLADTAAALHSGLTAASILLDIPSIAAGILLMVGLWTPIAAALIAILGLWYAISQTNGLHAALLLSAIGTALALLGPGIWSIDARLFGWKLIDLGHRDS